MAGVGATPLYDQRVRALHPGVCRSHRHRGARAQPAPALLGDYNENDIVDAADYSVWRDALTAGATTLPNDPTPGTVDESDFTYWRAHFSETQGTDSGADQATGATESQSVAAQPLESQTAATPALGSQHKSETADADQTDPVESSKIPVLAERTSPQAFTSVLGDSRRFSTIRSGLTVNHAQRPTSGDEGVGPTIRARASCSPSWPINRAASMPPMPEKLTIGLIAVITTMESGPPQHGRRNLSTQRSVVCSIANSAAFSD